LGFRGRALSGFLRTGGGEFYWHGVPAIFEAVAAQASQLEFVHSSQFTTAIAEDYAAELLEFAGKHFRGGSVYFTSGGSVARADCRWLAAVLDHRAVGDVRGIGLLWGVEFVADKTTKAPFFADLNFAGRVADAAKKRGLLVYPMQGSVNGHSGDHVLLAPAAVITPEQIDWAVNALRAAIEETCQSA